MRVRAHNWREWNWGTFFGSSLVLSCGLTLLTFADSKDLLLLVIDMFQTNERIGAMKRKQFKFALKRRLDTVIRKWMSSCGHEVLSAEAAQKEIALVNWIMEQFDELERGGGN